MQARSSTSRVRFAAGVPAPGYPLWHGIEIPVARAAGPVDAAVLNHHGLGDGNTEGNAHLQVRIPF